MAVTTVDVQKYLQLAKAIDQLPQRDFWTAYDSEADVLYISFHEPALPADDSELTDEDIIIRYNKQEEIIGLTVLHASKR